MIPYNNAPLKFNFLKIVPVLAGLRSGLPSPTPTKLSQKLLKDPKFTISRNITHKIVNSVRMEDVLSFSLSFYIIMKYFSILT